METIITTKAHGDVPVPRDCVIEVDHDGSLLVRNGYTGEIVDAWLPNGWVSFRVDNDYHKG